ncbi:hypothetical protein AJ79_05874 [Helicocarpus griseus UAMH5409]|uniref:NEDD8-conjugating enzyme UBC12 n=1 Tax=Helicocarpus griseus UAMH5409 TaxID=1447875 RepID=A0A2B7XIL8_9EURO|nr:hypothetical protein AJ79_05874 [Helicocarpus griseus UAMH5409]
MLKIWSMKKQQQEAAAAAPTKSKVQAAQLRVQHDLSRREKDDEDKKNKGMHLNIQFEYEDVENALHFDLVIEPDEGMYKGGSFRFQFDIPETFPFDPPKVKCKQKIYHPNIDIQGNVCLNILREEWKPVLDLNSVAFGLLHIFLEPNASDPLNKEAAEDLRLNREGFKRNIRSSMQGGLVRNEQYDRVLR